MAEDMKSALSCSICMDLYKEPVLLPCQHSLCKSCLERLRRPSERVVSRKVKCPECREDLDLGNGCENVKKNFQLASIINIYRGEIARKLELEKQQQQQQHHHQHHQQPPSSISTQDFLSSETNQVPCSTCEWTSVNPVTTRCSSCNLDFCGSCLGSFHPFTHPNIKTHDVKLLRVIQADEKCAVCKNGKWTVFCMECDILFCQACQLDHHPAELNHWIHRAKAAQRSVSMILSPTEPKPNIPPRLNGFAASMATHTLNLRTDSNCCFCSKPALIRCLDCEEILCEDCTKLKHDTNTNTNHIFIKMAKKPGDIEKLVQLGMLKLMFLKQAVMAQLLRRLG